MRRLLFAAVARQRRWRSLRSLTRSKVRFLHVLSRTPIFTGSLEKPGQKVESQELSFKHVQENLLGSKEVGNLVHKPHNEPLNLEASGLASPQLMLDCTTEVVEKADGLLLTTTQEGPGTVVRSSGKAPFDGDVSWSIGVRQGGRARGGSSAVMMKPPLKHGSVLVRKRPRAPF